jgi:hypothetical protein
MARFAAPRHRTTWALLAALVISGGALVVVQVARQEPEPKFCTTDGRLDTGDGHTYQRDHYNDCLWTDERGVVDPNQ